MSVAVVRLKPETNTVLTAGKLSIAGNAITNKFIKLTLSWSLIFMGNPRTAKWAVLIEPMGKPRMTRQDKWKKRDRVLRYRQWKDELLYMSKSANYPRTPHSITIKGRFNLPKSWTKKQKALKYGSAHLEKPDIDNFAKAVIDALFGEDKSIAELHVYKSYCEEGQRPAVIIEVTGED